MKLDRNVNGNGSGKYGLVNNRRLAQIRAWDGGDGEILDQQAVEDAINLLTRAKVIEWGYHGTPEEFFVVKLKDRYSRVALHAYADEAHRDGNAEYAEQVHELAARSGVHHPYCKRPD